MPIHRKVALKFHEGLLGFDETEDGKMLHAAVKRVIDGSGKRDDPLLAYLCSYECSQLLSVPLQITVNKLRSKRARKRGEGRIVVPGGLN